MMPNKKRNQKVIGLGILLPVGLFLLYIFGQALSPGVMPFAEYYELPVNQSSVIKLIGDFKRQNPQLSSPANSSIYQDGEIKQEFYKGWYAFYFYYQDENELVQVLAEPGSKSSQLVLVGVSHGLNSIGIWRKPNNILGIFNPNTTDKHRFEERILKPFLAKIQEARLDSVQD